MNLTPLNNIFASDDLGFSDSTLSLKDDCNVNSTPLNDISLEQNKDLVSLNSVSSSDRNKQLLKIANNVIKQFNGIYMLF